MTPEEERRRIAAERKAAYRRRKKEEALAELSSKSNSLPTPQEELALRLAEANGINVPPEAKFPPGVIYGNPTPEAEEAWKRVQPGNLEPLSEQQAAEYVSNREKAEAVQADSTARAEYVNMLFQKYAKTTNIPELLAGLIREIIETRIVLVDLLAEILKGVSK